MGLLEKIFGDLNEKEVKKLDKIADEIEALEPEIHALSDVPHATKAKTQNTPIFFTIMSRLTGTRAQRGCRRNR